MSAADRQGDDRANDGPGCGTGGKRGGGADGKPGRTTSARKRRLADGDVVVVDAGGTRTRIGHLRRGVPRAAFDMLDSRALAVRDPHLVLAQAVCAHAEAHRLTPVALVTGVPGMLDPERKVISHCNNIRALEGARFLPDLTDRLGIPVVLEQDIMLQLLGEWRAGVARGRDSAFGVYFGTGIGSAWLQGGDPFRARAACLQAGHIPVAGEGLPCRCGNTDCVEAYASGHTLQALAREHGVAIGELFVQGDHGALQVALERFIRFQAFMLATIVTLLEPDMIVIGGGIPSMPGYPRDRLLEVTRRHLQKPWPADHQAFGFAELSGQAPLHGARALLEHARTASG